MGSMVKRMGKKHEPFTAPKVGPVSKESNRLGVIHSIEKGYYQQELMRARDEFAGLAVKASNVGFNEMMIICMYYLHCKHGYGAKGLANFNKWTSDIVTGIKADRYKFDGISKFCVNNILDALEDECPDMNFESIREQRKDIDRLKMRLGGPM